MARIIGYTLGGLMLLNGIVDTLNPHLAFNLWRDGLGRYFPESVHRVVGEYSRLSDTARRAITVWEVATAIVVLYLASKSRE